MTDAARSAAPHETFLAGCYEKAEELDDSSGSFGQFIADLYLGWIQSAQAAGVDPDRLVAQMLECGERDPYGFAGDVPQCAASAMRGHSLRAFERYARAQFDTSGADDAHRRRWADVLRSIYLAQKRVRDYSELAQQMGLTAEDCHAIATLLAARRKPAQALDWVERGIELEAQGRYGSHAGFSLPTLRRRLLVQLGCVGDALHLLVHAKGQERLAELVRRACGARRGCASSTARRADTTARRSPISGARWRASSARGSPPSGTRPCSRCVWRTIGRWASSPSSRTSSRVPATAAGRRFWSGRRRIGPR